MKLSQFKFDLPIKRIAQFPPHNRDESRLMVVHRDTGLIEHKVFKDIIEYFDEGDIMVANDTLVFPARLYGSKEKTGAQIEVFLARELDREQRTWDVLVDPARKIRVGNKLFFGDSDLVAEVIDNTTSRGRVIRFLYDGSDDEFYRALDEMGQTPLPLKYITRKAEPEDSERYQTVFAQKKGAVAAPAAGLHFTEQLVKRLMLKGVEIPKITLHFSLGSFRTIEVEDLTKHKPDSESYQVPEQTCKMVNQALENKKKVCAIGLTTVKAMESSVSASGRLKPTEGWTDKFIFPPYEYKIPNALISNFHLPASILYMGVSAFGGYDLVRDAYEVAIKEEYNFFAYGDAMLIL